MMKKILAKRKLLYSLKGEEVKSEMVVRIYAPYPVSEDMVAFPIGEEGLSGCHVEVDGLCDELCQDVYGVDDVQALHIAADIDPFLFRLRKKYDLFWPSGEPYFED